jgi:hypothetical protein
MSQRRRGLVRWGFLAAVVGSFGIILGLSLAEPWAQSGGDPPADPGMDELPESDDFKKDPFTPYAADLGAVTYEDHRVGPPTDEDDVRPSRASVDDVQAFAEDNGHAVHQQWSAYTRQKAEQARVKAAEYESGTAGLGDVGVQ